MQNPTIPAWLTIVANAGLVIIPLILAQTSIPPVVSVVLGGVAAVLTYVAHLNTSRQDAKKLAAGAFPGRPS